ncbi:MAG: gliding motility-associated C-terminal domain-containing protein, partial [Bacteroidota bacterium]
CSNGSSSSTPCDDGDPCTINDEQHLLDCDGSICIPCAGIPTDCSNGSSSSIPCDDGDPNTINDEQRILDCDGSVCTPCQGILCEVVAAIQDPIGSLNCQSLESGLVLEGIGSSIGVGIVYEWLFQGGSLGNELSQEIFAEGVYQLIVTDQSTGCADSAEISISIPVVDLSPTLSINGESCTGQADGSLVIDAVMGGNGPYLYALNSGDFHSTNRFENLAPGIHWLTIQDVDGCESLVEVIIAEAPALFLNLGRDRSIDFGDTVHLSPLTNALVDSVHWDFQESLSCVDCLPAIAQPREETTYVLSLMDDNGCWLTDQITIFVDRTEQVFVPNVFSPNGDGINDYFTIYASADVKRIKQFKVFDRWGATLFAENDVLANDWRQGWDGRHREEFVNPGVYVYFVEVEYRDGRVEIQGGDLLLVH